MSLVETVAENIRTKRIHKKWSQAELAEKADLSVSYVSMLERGLRSPPLETIETLMKVFRAKVEEFFPNERITDDIESRPEPRTGQTRPR